MGKWGECIDETGNRYGRLFVIEFSHMEPRKSGGGVSMWRVRCECGVEKIVARSKFVYPYNRSKTVSCGCYKRERIIAQNQAGKGRRAND
jgi:hypothetical protein